MSAKLNNADASAADALPAIHLQKQSGRFKKGQSGNPAGKRPGTRNRATVLAENLLYTEAETLIRKLIELANSGDTAALRLCVDRLIPPRRTRPLRLALPPLRSPADAPKALAAVATGVAKGDISTNEAMDVVALVNAFLAAFEASNLARRVKELEKWRAEAA